MFNTKLISQKTKEMLLYTEEQITLNVVSVASFSWFLAMLPATHSL